MSAHHQGQPGDCPTCKPLTAASRKANEEWSAAQTMGRFTSRNSPAYKQAYSRATAAKRDLLAARQEHNRLVPRPTR